MKRILVIQDFCIFCKKSGGVSVSVLSAMGIEVIFVPVYISDIVLDDSYDSDNLEKSSHMNSSTVTDFEKHIKSDLSDKLPFYSDYFAENKIHFDCIFVNGCFNDSQIIKINDLIEKCITDDCFMVLNVSRCSFLYKILYEKTNILILPFKEIKILSKSLNITNLLDEYSDDDSIYSIDSGIVDISKALQCSLVITDFYVNSKRSGTVLVEKNKDNVQKFYHNNYNSGFCGLQDIFSAIISGAVVKGTPLEKAVKLGSDFIENIIKDTMSKPAHNWYGADFEQSISQLSDSLL